MNRSDAQRKVVVTGQGVVTPVGRTVTDFWDSLLAGRSGIRTISGFDTSDLPVRFAGEITDFDPAPHLSPAETRRIDRFAQFAVVAAAQALEGAKLDLVPGGPDQDRIGMVLGSGYGATTLLQGEYAKLAARGPRLVSPYMPAASSIDSPASVLSIKYGITGPTVCMSAACATGSVCVGEAFEWIRAGRADVVLAGGAEEPVSRLDIAGAANAGALSRRNDDPQAACRPFDRDRDGFVISSGAGILVLEEAEHAMRRGAPILAEVAGYGSTSDAYHLAAPHPESEGAIRAMHAALGDAGVRPEDVDYVNAHGTGTLLNDRSEVAALRAVLGDHAARIPVGSTKSMTGHMLGASGAVEAIATVLSIRTGLIPPTINCDDPEDPAMDHVTAGVRDWTTEVAMSNSFGFGGHNAVLVLRRFDG